MLQAVGARARARGAFERSVSNSKFPRWLTLLFVAASLWSTPALADRNFAVRYHTDDTGAIVHLGNTLLSCVQGAQSPPATCAPSVPISGTGATGTNLSDNAYNMAYVNTVGGTGVFNSSTANFTRASGTTVLFAGLYWSGETIAATGGTAPPNAALKGQVLFSTPTTAFQTIVASQLDTTTGIGGAGSGFSGFADVTTLVQAAGSGTYAVGNLQAATGQNRYGGWALIVVYRDKALPLRDMTVFDGYLQISTTSLSNTISGFRTPASGAFTTTVGAVAFDGDLGATGDAMRLNGVPLADAANPVTNFYNSTVSSYGVNNPNRNPNFANTLGIDIDLINTSGQLANGATSANVEFVATTGDTYFPDVITFSTDVFQPDFNAGFTKTVTDLNGGSVQPGDVLEYNLTMRNAGNDTATGVALNDPLPANVTYVPGSLAVVSGANAGAKSDAPGDDQAEFTGSAIRFRLGTGANASTGGTVAPNGTTSVRFRVQVNAGTATGTVIPNQATLNYNGATLGTPFTARSDGDPTVPGAQTTDVVVGGTATTTLSMTKVGNPDPVVPGQALTYTLTVTNSGPAFAANTVVSDATPANTTFASASAPAGWTIAAPAVGGTGNVTFSNPNLAVGTYTLTLVVTVNAAAPAPGTIGNTATLASPTDPDAPITVATNNNVVQAQDVSIVKYGAGAVGQNQDIAYTIAVNNPGPAASAVSVTDPTPTNTTFVSASAPAGWTVTAPAVGGTGNVVYSNASLPPGTYMLALTLHTTAAIATGSTLSNVATVTASGDPNPANNTATSSALVRNPVPTAAKSFTPASVQAGVDAVLTITLTNNATVALSGVTITDTLPTNLVVSPTPNASTTCGGTLTAAAGGTAISLAGGAIPAGPAATCTISVSVRASAAGTYVNTTGAVNSTQAGPGSVATATLDVAALAAAVPTKTFAPNPVGAGGTSVMTIAFTNPNASAVTGVAFTDTYPSGLQNVATGAVVAGNTCGGTVTATNNGTRVALAGGTVPVAGCAIQVNVTAPFPGTYVNSTGPIVEGNAVDSPGATATLTTTQLAAPTATKAFNPASITANGASQMTITLTNPNTIAIVNAAFVDTYPAGLQNAASGALASNTCGGAVVAPDGGTSTTFAGGTIPASGSCTIVVNVVGTTIGALVNATGPITSNNAATGTSATGTLTVSPSADLSVAKTGPASVGLGGAITYTVVVSNAGPNAADGAQFSDPVPAGITGVSANCTPAGGAACGAVNVAGNTVTSTITTLPAGGSVTFSISGTAPATGTSLSNTATIAVPAGTVDPNGGNNSSTATTTLTTATLTVSKSATPNPFVVGQPASYSIVVQNTGAGATSAPVTIADTLPAGITLASASGTNWSCAGTTALSCTFSGTLASGASTTLTLNVNVAASATNANNTATASGGGDATCPAAAHCSGTATVPVTQSADIAIDKTVDNATPNVGETITFTVGATNQGPSNATGVVVTDALPSGLAFVSALPSQGTYDNTTGAWTVGALANGANATLDIVATVLVPGTLTNVATRTAGDQLDPDPSNNSAQSSVNANPTADLQVAKIASSATPNLGTNVTYTITLTNAGPNDATGVVIADALPAGLVFVAATPSQGTYDSGTGLWTVGALADASVATLDLVATVTLPGDITNTASVQASDQFDPNTANNAGGVTVNGQSSDLQVVKTVDDANPVVGDTVTFTITATNNGPSAATGIEITDALPPELSFVSATPSQGAYSNATGVWNVGSLAAAGAGATATLTIVATVVDDGGFTNTADVTASDTPDPNPANNSSSVVVTPIASADVSIVKSGPATVVAGSNVSYTLAVTNAGPSDAANVVLDDPTPAGLTFVSATAPCASGFPCDLGTLAASDVVNVTATFAVPAGASGTIANTASVTSDTQDPNPNNDDDTVSTQITAEADLSTVKTGPAAVVAGGAISYSVVVTNNGPSNANGSTVTDAVPAAIANVTASCGAATNGAVCGAVNVTGNTVTSTITTLPANGSVTLTISGIAPTEQGALSNSATGAPPAGVTDPDPSDNTSTAGTDVTGAADLSITKTGPATANPGGTVSYTIVVANAGPSTASAVQIIDQTPTGLAFVSATAPCASGFPCALGDLASGASTTITVVYSIPGNFSGAIANTASVSSATGDPDPSDNSSTATTGVGALADVSIVKNGPANVDSGGAITYTLRIANAGPSAADGATYSDTLPAAITNVVATCGGETGGAVCAIPSVAGNTVSGAVPALPPGGAVTITITGLAPVGSTTLTNTATVEPPAGVGDPNPADNTSTVQTTVGSAADIAVAKTVDNATPNVGDTVTFTIVASNNGPNDATGVAITDGLPFGLAFVSATPSQGTYVAASGLWTVGAIANGSSATLTIVATVSAPGALVNTATVSASDQVDPNTSNNSAGAALNAGASADLAVAKSVDNATPNVGDTVTFTVTLTNNGPDGATGAEVTDPLPAGLTLVSATPSQGSYDAPNGVWSVGSLANGASATLAIAVTVDSAEAIANVATITGENEFDPAQGNNQAGAAVNGQLADIGVVKTVDDASPQIGDTVTFTVTAHNAGPDNATGVIVTDNLPAGLTLVSATPSQGTFANGTWTIGALSAAGATSTATLTIAASVDASGPITNTATVTASDQPDPNATNDSGSASLNGTPLANVAIVKTGPASALPGDMLTYTIVVTNAGPSDAANVVVDDALPAGTQFVSNAGDCTSAFPCTFATLASGASVTITTSVLVPPDYAGGANIVNTATVTSDTPDPDNTDNSAFAPTTIGTTTATADLGVVKTGPATATAGGTATYTLEVTNNGPDTATNVVLDDPAPAGFAFISATTPCESGFPCALGDLPSGATTLVSVTFAVAPNAPASVVNTASVTSGTNDLNPTNNTSDVTTTIASGATSADLVVTKTGPATADASANATYTIVVANNGPDAAINVVLADPTPAGLAFVGADAPCASGFPCALGDLASGASVTARVTFAVTGAAGDAVTNTASASSDTPDPDGANNMSSAATTITAPTVFADLGVVKTGPASVEIGETVTYTIVVSNAGPDAAVDAVLADATPPGLAFAGADAPCAGGFPCALGTLASGASVTVTARFTVLPSAPATVVNTAIASSATSDPNGANSSSSATTTVLPGGGPNPPPTAIPAADRWALLLLALLLVGVAFSQRRRV